MKLDWEWRVGSGEQGNQARTLAGLGSMDDEWDSRFKC
jgi:hypothetical protein